MKIKKFDIDPADADADGLAATNSSAGATLTLDGALTSGGTYTSADGLGHKIDITDTATLNQSGATFTISGTDANGNSITDAVTGPTSGATVSSAKFFKTVSGIAITSPVATATVSAGTNDEVESKVIPVNWRADEGATVAIQGASGTFQVDIQETFDEILSSPSNNANFHDIHADKTGNGSFLLTKGATGVRVQTDSFTSGAEFQLHVISTQ